MFQVIVELEHETRTFPCRGDTPERGSSLSVSIYLVPFHSFPVLCTEFSRKTVLYSVNLYPDLLYVYDLMSEIFSPLLQGKNI